MSEPIHLTPDDNPKDAPKSRADVHVAGHGSHPYGADEIDLLELIKVIWRARRMIVGVTFVAVAIAFAFTIMQGRTYESQAVFAIQNPSALVGIGQTSGQTTAVLSGVLNSRQLAETVVDSLSLADTWETADRQAAVKRLQKAVSISANSQSDIITVSIEDRDPILARDIVATYVALFEERANELNVTETEQILAFAEERLTEAESGLAEAETSLRDFKERYGIVDFEQQIETLVEAHAMVTDSLRTSTVDLLGKRSHLTDRDPDVQELIGRIDELERQARILEHGTDIGSDPSGASQTVSPLVDSDESRAASVNFGLRQAPSISIELRRLEREANLQRATYEQLRGQYEAASLNAGREINITRFIDPPEVPHEPMARGLVLNVVLAGFVGAFAALMFAFIAEFLRQRAQDEDAVKELPFLRHFRGRETSS